MALSMLYSTPVLRYCTLSTRRQYFRLPESFDAKPHTLQCIVPNRPHETCTVVRRTANYQASIWDYDYVQSLTSDYAGETFAVRLIELKREVIMMLEKAEKPLDQLQLIDHLQRLGVSYQFHDEISRLLNRIHCNYNRDDEWKKENLNATALEFRILRQHGYSIPQDVFSRFKDDTGSFESGLHQDMQGILSLYEASYLSIEGESILDEARDFTKKHLKEWLEQNTDENLAILVSHALELPLHWRMLRLEARWFIDLNERTQNMNPVLLEFAKLDYNVVQAKHQEDLKHASRWWRCSRLGEKLSFARDRLMENFLWNVGVIFEPQFGYCRRMSTKVNALITTVDDIYDIYGTLDELELFTDAVDRWDINAMDRLPQYMKICFLALYNSTNEIAYDLLADQGCHIVAYLSRAWADLCKSYLQEAKWYHVGYTPTLQEYLTNAWISISAPTILVHAYFLVTNPITEEALELLEISCNLIRWSATILRLADDLGTSSDELKRGDVPKSIQCYMHETNASEEEAREYIQCLIGETWKKMNEDRVKADSPFPRTFIEMAVNLARMSQCMYQYGDGHGVEDRETKDRVLSLLVEPIPLNEKLVLCSV